MTKIDVVIATYNGGKRLRRTLESLTRLTLPKSDWRLLMVLNACTDNSRSEAEAFSAILPMTIIEVAEPGKSHALNEAVPHYQSDLVAFTDDDVTVDPEWLSAMIDAAAAHPAYGVFTGKIVGRWEREPSAKLRRWVPLGSTYAVNENPVSAPCGPGEVWGPNTVYRRAVFDAGLRYNKDVGPRPGKLYPMGQDTEMATRVCQAGFSAYYVAEAVVEHTIKADTVSEDWVVRRAERLAYGIFAIGDRGGYRRRFPKPVPLAADIALNRFFWSLVYPLTFILPEGKQRFWAKWRFFYFRGLWSGYKRFSKQ
ncbi:glycosyltransferase [Rhizobium changzhiense]|uniref:glycosyltransferase n=1 Tax=Rhizobium changzhiense TaxID=2692317 RepID=UPI001F0C612A|nr:glycosyltransferase family 2 protein [Rhizobium changzhiense]MCH4545377.1 glycosyltransferase [Rhizobium changzhiense]